MKTITCIRTPHGRVSGWRRRWYVRIGKITLKKKKKQKKKTKILIFLSSTFQKHLELGIIVRTYK